MKPKLLVPDPGSILLYISWTGAVTHRWSHKFMSAPLEPYSREEHGLLRAGQPKATVACSLPPLQWDF